MLGPPPWMWKVVGPKMMIKFSTIILAFYKSFGITDWFFFFPIKVLIIFLLNGNAFLFHLHSKKKWACGFPQTKNQRLTPPLLECIHKIHSPKIQFLKISAEHFVIAKHFVRFSLFPSRFICSSHVQSLPWPGTVPGTGGAPLTSSHRAYIPIWFCFYISDLQVPFQEHDSGTNKDTLRHSSIGFYQVERSLAQWSGFIDLLAVCF